ncbi:hypothetical protein D3C72_896770 [compost metagenome]
MLPGEGFISNPEPASTTVFSYHFINSKKRFPSLSSIQRFTNSCSTPHNSGNSERIVVPPKATKWSDNTPNVGFAEIPEKPSDPPHSKPILSLDNGAGCLLISFAFLIASKVSFTTLLNIVSIVPIDC